MTGDGQRPARPSLGRPDPDHCTWRNQYTPDGASWNLIEEYAMGVGS